MDWAVARLYSGRPNEAAFAELARPDATFDYVEDRAVGTLVRRADPAWYDRAYEAFFAPRLHASADGTEMQFHAPLPADMLGLLTALGGDGHDYEAMRWP